MFKVPEKFRVTAGVMGSDESYGNNGQFIIRSEDYQILFVQASDGAGWEHVSVSVYGADRCPTWDEMCFVKDLFWDAGDVVIQIHPASDQYVNNHPYCLHLWRKLDTNDFVELPGSDLVGIKAG
jgi:hypothetical protein